MRQVALFLLLAVALAAGAAEIWRWTDADGVVHYSDQPRPGAERVTVNVSRPSGATQPVAEPGDEGRSESQARQPQPPARPFAYTNCTVSSPQSDEVFQGVQDINVDLAIEPELQPGHRIQVYVNGTLRRDWPPQATSHTFAEVFRGSHTVEVRILDAGGRVLCAGPGLTFHLRQQSVLSPGRQGPAGG